MCCLCCEDHQHTNTTPTFQHGGYGSSPCADAKQGMFATRSPSGLHLATTRFARVATDEIGHDSLDSRRRLFRLVMLAWILLAWCCCCCCTTASALGLAFLLAASDPELAPPQLSNASAFLAVLQGTSQRSGEAADSLPLPAQPPPLLLSPSLPPSPPTSPTARDDLSDAASSIASAASAGVAAASWALRSRLSAPPPPPWSPPPAQGSPNVPLMPPRPPPHPPAPSAPPPRPSWWPRCRSAQQIVDNVNQRFARGVPANALGRAGACPDS